MAKGDSPIEGFKQVTAAAMRAIARKAELTVTFSPEPPQVTGTEARLPLPSREMNYTEACQLRGFADSLALGLRHHNNATHQRRMPKGSVAKQVYDQVERARCDALGAKRMAGVRGNLAAALDRKCREEGYEHVVERDDQLLPEVLGLLAREAFTGDAPPPSAKRMVDAFRSALDARVGKDFIDMSKALDDQDEFSRLVRRLIQDLELEESAEQTSEEQQQDDENDDQNKNSDTNQEDQPDSSAASEASMPAEMTDTEESQEQEGAADGADQELMGDDGEEEPAGPGRSPRPDNQAGRNDKDAYKAFTEEFDEINAAEELCEPDEHSRLRQKLYQQLSSMQGVLA
ncbi:MAG: cobaltochelatase subunit CobT, partial [Alphaproteobacteria bacterium]